MEPRGDLARRPQKYLYEMAWTSVADFQRDFDEDAGDQPLSLQHALSGHQLQKSHPPGDVEPQANQKSTLALRADCRRFGCYGRPTPDRAKCGVRP